jgi:hypothetical protein
MNDFDVEVVDRAIGGSAECPSSAYTRINPCCNLWAQPSQLAVAVNGLEFIKKASRARSSQIFFFRSENKEIHDAQRL